MGKRKERKDINYKRNADSMFPHATMIYWPTCFFGVGGGECALLEELGRRKKGFLVFGQVICLEGE